MSEGLLDDACRSLMQPAILPARARNNPPEPHLVIFNLDTRPRGGFCQMDVDLPGAKPVRIAAPGDGGRAEARAAPAIPARERLVDSGLGRAPDDHAALPDFSSRRPVIPPMSWLTLKVVPAAAAKPPPPLLSRGRVLENDFLKAVVRADGRVDLTHKEDRYNLQRGCTTSKTLATWATPGFFQARRPARYHVWSRGNRRCRGYAVARRARGQGASGVAAGPSGRGKGRHAGEGTRCCWPRGCRSPAPAGGSTVETTIDNGCRDHRVRVCSPHRNRDRHHLCRRPVSVDERPHQATGHVNVDRDGGRLPEFRFLPACPTGGRDWRS